ncbi:hypothetical protein YYC_05572 [Plasmodium yoelii 17X]|uniref:Uncharacterized protein n=1 Tax=Plasmodium yoelii 17X TaxID=1323249 RepID=V7PA44_PLAYE|nr:hypothetical protein YYC_05572 [Plasmodium yoelii 17X]
MKWLSYILSLKSNNNFNNLNKFYKAHIKENISEYITPNINANNYRNFKGLIDTNTDLMNIDIKYMTKFDSHNKWLSSLSKYYNSLKNHLSIFSVTRTSSKFPPIGAITLVSSSISQKFKTYSSPSELLPLHSDDTSNSLMINKLISIISVFCPIPIFLGIAYKTNNKAIRKYNILKYFHHMLYTSLQYIF